jgi:hypothetical protein
MGTRPRLLLTVLVALVAVLVAAGVASSRPGSPTVVTGSVRDDGAVLDAPGWTVEHTAPGVYRVAAAPDGVVLDVPSWEAPADVTIIPVGGGITEIHLSLDGRPVDTAFSFTGQQRP